MLSPLFIPLSECVNKLQIYSWPWWSLTSTLDWVFVVQCNKCCIGSLDRQMWHQLILAFLRGTAACQHYSMRPELLDWKSISAGMSKYVFYICIHMFDRTTVCIKAQRQNHFPTVFCYLHQSPFSVEVPSGLTCSLLCAWTVRNISPSCSSESFW